MRARHKRVAEALKVLEWSGVPTWQHRITRVRERCTDLFWRWRVVSTSNAYAFRDPQAAVSGRFPSKSDYQPGTLNQEIPISRSVATIDPDGPLERALARFGAAVAAKDRIEQERAS